MDSANESDKKTITAISAEELTFVELIRVLTDYRLVLISVAATIFLLATVYAFVATPIYRAEVLVTPADDSATSGGALSSLMSRFGGITSMMGMGRLGRRDRVTEGVATLKSPQFTIEYIEENNLLPVLFAGKWNAEANKWDVPDDEIPSYEDGYIYFNEKIRTVIEEDTGVIRLVVEWKNPEQAALWANEQISRLNERLRRRAIDEANKTIDYLNKEVEKTRIVELQQAIYFMIESQINTRTMANVREEFAFKIISPAIAPDPDRFIKPRRTFIILMGAIAGLIMGVFMSFFLFAVKRVRNELAQ